MPARPKLGEILRNIGHIEVFPQRKTKNPRQPDRHVRIGREIKVDLQRKTKQAQPGIAQAAMRENAAIQREGMQQAGANQRTIIQALRDQERLALDRETQGVTNKGKTIVQALQEQIAAEQDPAKRQSIVQRLRDVQGGQTADPYLVVPGGQQVDENGRPYNMPSSVFNRQTGTFVQQPGVSGQPGQPVPDGWKQVGTANGSPVYQDSQGNRHIAG